MNHSTYAVIEPGMVGLRERDNELPRVLVGHEYADTRVTQPLRAHQRYKLEKYLLTGY